MLRPRLSRSRRAASATAVLLGAVLLAGCGGSSASAPGAASSTPAAAGAAAPLTWGSCGGGHKSRDRCATLRVPLDYAAPNGRTISLELIRARATGTHRIGSLLINPGGPGASAVDDFDTLVGDLSSTLRSRFDIVGFDPRGVGRSSPVRCTDAAGLAAYTALDLSPSSAAGLAALQSGAQRIAAGCAATSGDLLAHIGTADAARDMDRIRAAVGDERLSYLGFSYGTFLGAEYAQLFPTHVRALALDGALDPTLSAVAGAASQSRGFQSQLDAFLADCARRGSCDWKISGDPHEALRALVAQVEATPEPAGDGRALHAGELFYGIGVSLYARESWPELATALAGVAHGDGTAMLALSDIYTERSDKGYSNAIEANLAVECRDFVWPADPSTFVARAAEAAKVAPDFGTANLDLELACAYWPVGARAKADPGPFTARGAPPILVIATTGDPATPYDEGVALAKQLSSGTLLTNVGEQHTAYQFSACVRQYADRYLTDLVVPPPATRCDDEGASDTT